MAGDYGSRYTDEEFGRVKKRLNDVYTKAYWSIKAKTRDFWRRHVIKDKIYRKQVQEGKLAQEDYEAWMKGQVFQGNQWQAKLDQIADVMKNADKTARRIVNGEVLNVFAANANYIGYSLEVNDAKANLGFGVYDSATVARLIKDEPDLLPMNDEDDLSDAKERAYYQKVVSNSVLQGIIQGEGLDRISERIALNCQERGMNAAVRDARTAYTGAQNAGRVEGMRQARDELGIRVQKQWMSTFDFKTRDTHRELDGQTVGVDDYFYVDGYQIKYPGDPSAEPEMVYNCRCRLGYVYPEYPADLERRDDIDGKTVKGMTYKEWYEAKWGEEAEKKWKAEHGRK